jgi:polynucleotide 5'-hydroxyl-kinase GRC3/NOL9
MTDDAGRIVDLLREKAGSRPVTALVLGGTDMGKTTLVAEMAVRLAEERLTAVVDADVGQSHIGPPAAVAWALAEPGQRDLTALLARGLYFVGSVAPTGYLLPLTVAIGRACQDAARSADVVIVDTGGFISDQAARALWWQVHRLVAPQVVVAVQRGVELEPILGGIATTSKVMRLAPSPQVRVKSPQQRQQFRAERFAAYFREVKTYELDLPSLSLQSARPGTLSAPEQMTGRLVALRNAAGSDQALAVVRQWQDTRVVVTCPPVKLAEIRGIIAGEAFLEGPGAAAW